MAINGKQLLDFNCGLLHETKDAYLVTSDDEDRIWLPKSQTEMEKKSDGSYSATIPVWLAIEKKLI